MISLPVAYPQSPRVTADTTPTMSLEATWDELFGPLEEFKSFPASVVLDSGPSICKVPSIPEVSSLHAAWNATASVQASACVLNT